MKHLFTTTSSKAVLFPLVLALCWTILPPAQTRALADDPIAESCPLTSPDAYTASVAETMLVPEAGAPFAITVQLDPEEPPPGFFVTVQVEKTAGPDGADIAILPGFPDSTLTVDTPGQYSFSVSAYLFAKSSCGGVTYRELSEEIVTVRAGPGE